MTPEEMKAAPVKMNDDAWHRRDLVAACGFYSEGVVFQRVPFPPVVGKEANMQADAGMLAASLTDGKEQLNRHPLRYWAARCMVENVRVT